MKNPPPSLELITSVVARYRTIVPDWSAFIAALQRPLPLCMWTNTLRSDAQELQALLNEADMLAQPLPWRSDAFRIHNPAKLSQQWWYLAGLAHAQEEVSQVPVTLLDAQPGMRVWDMCAAPGGKTAQIAMALQNSGTVVANDISTGRLRALSGNMERLGLVNVVTTRADAATYPKRAGQFDRVLLDAPCSGEGTLRKNPTHTERMGEAFSQELSVIQQGLLRKAIQLCKPGGRIVYSTCTFAPEENEQVVNAVLHACGDEVKLLPARIESLSCSTGLTSWQGRHFSPELEKCMRLWPHQNDTGGFFVAVLEKSASLPEVAWQPGELTEPEVDWRTHLEEEYGFDETVWQHFRAHRQCNRGLHLSAHDLEPTELPKPESQGAMFYRPATRPPRMTTVAAQLLGRYAKHNCLTLETAQLMPYLGGECFALSPSQMADVTPGYLLIFYRGYCLGLGIYHGRSQTLQSQFPKKWCGRHAL